MYLNGYSVRVPEGTEASHGYVQLSHGQTFTLVLGNKSSCRANVTVKLDGKDVGTWRMERGQTVTLERPANDAKLFTFYSAASAEGAKVASDVHEQSQGLLTVEFVPEDTTQPAVLMNSSGNISFDPSPLRGGLRGGSGICGQSFGATTSCSTSSYSGGVTGLSGSSSQRFRTAGHMPLDLDARQTVNLRLVCRDESVLDDPMPLRPVMSQSTPVPPPA